MSELLTGWTSPDRALALPVTVAIPLLGIAALLLVRRNPNAREAASLLSGVALVVAVLGLWPVAGDDLRFELWTWLPGLSLEFALEPLGLLFATVAAVLWPVTTVFAAGYLRADGEHAQTRFFSFFALTIAAAMWIALSGNLVTLFIGYEIMTLATWPLVAHKGGADARRGARTYLVVLLTTSVGLLLPAIVWTWLLAGSTEFRPGGLLTGHAGTGVLTVLFALYLFGIGKAALMPVHRWLPAAMVAPTPVSALLHAVAVVKAGVFTVLKVAVYVFGLDTLGESGASRPVMWVAAFTVLAAAVVALRSDNLKRRLAYSTVSQLAYIVLAATLARDVALAGGALHMVTHAVGKITLFLCAGAIYVTAKKTKVSELDGLGRAMPWTFGAFLVATVSIVGLPPAGGMWSKWLLLLGTVDAEQFVMLAVLLVGSVLSLGYLMPITVRAFFRPPHGPLTHGEAHPAIAGPLTLTALGCVALFFAADAVLAPLTGILELP
ncbi:proton-conducting transporter transmembrane domain-containing protein [Actinophytocola algeriensis]|uniref:Multicomponent Na+:H+ antiporter subunit D n=1 Tax=Actinophytocola algeriensis TaxID=1768010 RepID=A0A7W7Q832_9PSEU|nr:proton-conducting transporter membrane subunit [Actinophytocola algeriensis]MBB4908780.1 multicomponent Na+:H+ antiporter subunit D [Actinophytocola algeriensis]MBE1474833.1 multicomponent Na+:H+ antiporter subunit D [Actinophytocola algeriensis]